MVELLALLRQTGKTLATAESCTGGLLGSMITAVPGSSQVYEGGVVSYSNAVKHNVLHVPQELLDTYGAVSAPVAEAMAKGICEVCGSSVGIGITGIAGPGSDGTEKPVGLVYLGYCDEHCCVSRELRLNGTRDEIRMESCRQAIAFIKEYLNA